MNDDIPLKHCSACEKFFPATTAFFHRNKTNGDGLHSECKTCRGAKRKVYNSRPRARERHNAHNKTYRSRPEIQEKERAHKKAYESIPERQEYRRTLKKSYRSQPEVKARLKKSYKGLPEMQEKWRIRSATRQARKKAIQGSHTPAQIQDLLKRQRHKCYYCHNKFEKRKEKYIYHVDHTFPLSRVAGTDIPANDISYLVLTCPTCNVKKNNKFPWEFPEGGRLL